MGIYELLVVDQEMRRMIVRDATLSEIRERQRTNGSQTLITEGIRLAENGHTSLDEAIRVAFFD